MPKHARFVLIGLALAVAACGRTEGSVVGLQQTCRQTWRAGTCDVSFGRLIGTYVDHIEDSSINATVILPIEVILSVEVGTVRMSVAAADGTVSTVAARPGEPVTLLATVQGMWEQLPIVFEAVDGEASGIRYSVTYRMPI